MPNKTSRSGRPYGWRARLGLIVPPTNTVNETEWWQAAPEGVTIHTVRMPLHLDAPTPDGKARLEGDLAAAARDLASASVDVIAYGCTAGSLVHPVESLAQFVTAETGLPAISTAQALVETLSRLGLRRIALTTPYDEKLTAHERDFLIASGFDVVCAAGMGFGAGGPHEYRQIAGIGRERLMALVLATDRPAAEAALVSCTDLPTLNALPELREALGKPIVTSNGATFEAALRRADV